VLRHGGRFFCLEFSSSEWPGFADLYDRYASRLIPKIGKAVASDEASYRYLVESIRRFPKPDQFRQIVAEAGLRQTKVEPILGGLVCIWSGWKI
jgi:demethylmenaquinone methyltransferase/2-methoxy-6-polyprenyl-1,4-benzoquinol methylase